ncbi:MAG: 1-deoxy-D-xylulose-5-phosphate reductoisomerase [Lachnospiraceae bacterium]|nr:1-deoxy-D-xylulose-5-phosphate reductoisomerase [Lachnospiraceae bacterium]MBR5993246.1 1-deoxy-D-xylulose-5-phosphate reductoisomerase [Lachnospiraceae bacterium]
MKNLVILGSTGSIGTQTLDIVRAQEGLKVFALAASTNVDLMEAQIREFKPSYAVMYDSAAYRNLKDRVKDLDVTVLEGMDGLLEICSMPGGDVVVTALVGMIGIQPTIAAIKARKTIALANKETLVTAGHIIMPLAREYGVSILPVDSEHSAIFQSLNGENKKNLSKILLTASGGPFRGKTFDELKSMTVEDALKHPNWSMGKKVTIDSATLVNKGLEVIEAKWLFDVEATDIQVVIQPQSIIHSMVEYVDGSVIAQLGVPDMKLPIQYALFYPDRRPMSGNKLDFYKLREITFYEPDIETFRGLKYAYKAIGEGGVMPTVFNAANELAVKDFLSKKIGFTGIYEYIEAAMEEVKNIQAPTVEEILSTEAHVYEILKKRFK